MLVRRDRMRAQDLQAYIKKDFVPDEYMLSMAETFKPARPDNSLHCITNLSLSTDTLSHSWNISKALPQKKT